MTPTIETMNPMPAGIATPEPTVTPEQPPTPTADSVSPTAAPAKPAGSPVIRRIDVLNENSYERMLKRVAPAWAISGGIHVMIVIVLLFVFRGNKAAANPDDKIVTTTLDDAKDKEDNLTNEDVGLDANLEAAVESEREAPKNVEAPVVDNMPVDAAKTDNEAAMIGVTGFGNPDTSAGSSADLVANSNTMAGKDGGFSAMAAKGLSQRGSGATKDMLLNKYGGTSESEAAVGRGLAWLAKQQKEDGSWAYADGSKSNEVAAATGMALLPFLAAGETHKYGKKYQKTVAKGLTFLQGLVGSNGKVARSGSMYGQGIATIALCEAVGMTRDKSQLREKAQSAVNYIVKAQAKEDGSWGYQQGNTGDTSIVGWQIQALKSAVLAELKVDKAVFDKAAGFLDKVGSDSGSRYGYRSSNDPSDLRSAVGLLCRQYINHWGPANPGLAKGVEEFTKRGMPTKRNVDIYYVYYATQVIHFNEGDAWHKIWNPTVREIMIATQNKMDSDRNYGSWEADQHSIGDGCGRLGTTCLSLLTLEVYYRHLPLNKRDNGGLAELDK